MRRTLRIIMAYLSIVVIVSCLAVCAFRLGDAKTTGERSAGAEYSILRNALVSIQTQNDLSDMLLRNRLLALYRGSDRLLVAQIQDSAGNVLWKIPASSSYYAKPGESAGLGGFSAPQWSTVVYSTPLSEGMKLFALYTTVRKSDISEAVKLPLLLLAIWCLLLALACVLLRKEPAGESEPEGQPQGATAPSRDAKAKPRSVRTSYVGVLPQAFLESEDLEPAEAGPEEQAERGAEEQALQPEPVVAEETTPGPAAEALQEAASQENGSLMAPSAVPAAGNTEEDIAGEPCQIPSGKAEPEISAAGEAQTDARAESYPAQQTMTPDTAQSETPGVDRNFEEGYAKLEEQIIEWSSRYPKQGPQRTPDFRSDEFLTRESVQEPVEEESPAEGMTSPQIPVPPAEAAEPETVASQRAPEPANARVEKHDVRTLPMPLTLSDSLLEHTLSEELARNDGTGAMTLLLVHCEVNGPSDPLSTALAATIRDYFGTKDLLFELYRGAFAVLLPGADLGASLKMSEDLADVLSTTMSLYKDLEGEAPVFIGISSRSGRKIDSFKLYREASTAIHKAFSDGNSRILAFRPKSA